MTQAVTQKRNKVTHRGNRELRNPIPDAFHARGKELSCPSGQQAQAQGQQQECGHKERKMCGFALQKKKKPQSKIRQAGNKIIICAAAEEEI